MIVMVVVCILVFILLVMMTSITPERDTLSRFELERRKDKGDTHALQVVRRERLLIDVLSLQRVFVALFLVVFVLVSVATFGWLLGIVVAVVMALEYGAIARMNIVQKRINQQYVQYESRLLVLIEKFPGLFRMVRSVRFVAPPAVRLDSREELQHLVDQAGSLLTSDERKLILHGLQFDTKQVSDRMTPKSMIDSIDKKELLGPLTLDELHKTGHSRFPVIDGDSDHVVGMLHVQDLLTLDKKRSVTAEKAMEARVYYIRQDQTLSRALAAFLRTHHHLFIVVNEFRETVGLLSLEDVIEALLGRKIVDEFDTHDDLRLVAARNPHQNNHPESREDV
jgi:CBS domain containing-hemolysin-like protein